MVSGLVRGVQGPVRDIVIEPEMLDITVPPGTVFPHPVQEGHTAFAYMLDGEGYFDDRRDAYAYEMVGARLDRMFPSEVQSAGRKRWCSTSAKVTRKLA